MFAVGVLWSEFFERLDRNRQCPGKLRLKPSRAPRLYDDARREGGKILRLRRRRRIRDRCHRTGRHLLRVLSGQRRKVVGPRRSWGRRPRRGRRADEGVAKPRMVLFATSSSMQYSRVFGCPQRSSRPAHFRGSTENCTEECSKPSKRFEALTRTLCPTRNGKVPSHNCLIRNGNAKGMI